jgi:hypothetical protein
MVRERKTAYRSTKILIFDFSVTNIGFAPYLARLE